MKLPVKLQDTYPRQVMLAHLSGSETCLSVREAGLETVGSAGKNPEVFDSPWVNHYRLRGHFDKDTVTFLRLSTSDASYHSGP